MDSDAKLVFYDHRIFLEMANARKRLDYIPLKKASAIAFTPRNPLITIVGSGESYKVYYGNRRLTRLYPEYFDYDSSITAITLQIDGTEKNVEFGQMVDVDHSFRVVPRTGYRVNVIGFNRPGIADESGISIRRSDIQKRFSVDKKGRMYRVKVYHEGRFSGMVLVNFSGTSEHLLVSRSRKVSPLHHAD
ncbi:MAG TPA: hypothetical protein EYP19_17175 [Desulfobacterales bacterium]|nr:hypothetical protein [Desulfobacterales bacterium]